MFTGIVQAQGRIARTEPIDSGLRLVVDRSGWTPPPGSEPKHGDSVCVSGVCLTVVTHDGNELAFDVIPETLEKTTLGALKPGDPVNLETSVTPNQPLGGHFMQGHVDGVGEVVRIDDNPADWRVAIRTPVELRDYFVTKGSVAIDGVSLTLADVTEDTIEVALIPTTLEITTLGQRKAGDRVNLEADIMAKTVALQLQRMLERGESKKPAGGVDSALLQAAGFMASD